MLDLLPGKINSSKPRWLLILAIIFFIIFIPAIAGLAAFDNIYKNKICPNIFIGPINLGGKSLEQARNLVNQAVDKISQRGIIFSYKNSQIAITPLVASADGGLAYQIITFDVDRAVNSAFNYGKNDNFLINLKNKLLAIMVKQRLSLTTLINREEIIKILRNNFSDTYETARDAELIVKKIPLTDDYEFSVAKEKFGKTINFEEAIGQLSINLADLNPAEIKLFTITQYPKILAKNSLNTESKARKLLNSAPLALKYGDQTWILSKDLLSQMLALKVTDSDINQVGVGLDDVKFRAYLTEEIASKIDIQPIEAKFIIDSGKVTEFQNGQDGLALDIESSFVKIENRMTENSLSTDQAGLIDLEVRLKPVLAKAGNINSLGIKEIIGIGTSTFAGSPANRRHNIKVGSDKINGLLIKPGEEFSLLKALGEVTGATGYLPELVIKENKTTPEFGGGLCQVGTTMFRTVVASGLPVTLRRNHSYRVSYYEPAGTDATIYDPWPDFRFINDMPSYILIQAKVATNTLSYEFWGTLDQRLIEKTKPTIYNIVKPQPTKIIETLDLKPGVKKCTETAHNGADAYFDYKVTYPDGAVKEKRFASHYVPWQEVCLLGVEKLSAPPAGEAGTASSTPATIETKPLTN